MVLFIQSFACHPKLSENSHAVGAHEAQHTNKANNKLLRTISFDTPVTNHHTNNSTLWEFQGITLEALKLASKFHWTERSIESQFSIMYVFCIVSHVLHFLITPTLLH
jgi:hypothetical protein